MKLLIWQKFLLSLLSGILLSISFPHTGSLFPLAFVAWVPLLLVEQSLYEEKKSVGVVFIYAFIAFFGYNTGSNYWLYYTKNAGAIISLAHLFNALLKTLMFLLYYQSRKSFDVKWGRWLLLIAWVGFEYLHFNWELSTPWMAIGNVFAIVPQLAQWYSFTGVLGGTTWILVVNILIVQLIVNRKNKDRTPKQNKKEILILALSLFLPALLSIAMYYSYEDKGKTIEVVISQPNTEQYEERKQMYLKDQLDRMFDEVDKVVTENTAVVIGPETVIPNQYPVLESNYAKDTAFHYMMHRTSKWNGTALFVGLASFETFDKKLRFNMKLDEKSGKYYERYDASVLIDLPSHPKFVHKTKLLLMAEKIPFSKYFPFLENHGVDLRGTSGTLGIGGKPEVLRTHGFSFAPVICYESIYGEWISKQCKNGAETIFVITNDGWWRETAGYKQHASFSRLRAIENRKYVARSAMTGTSMIINQRGDVLHATEYHDRTAFKADIRLNKKTTFYSKNGDLLGKIALFGIYLLIIGIIGKWGYLKLSKKS